MLEHFPKIPPLKKVLEFHNKKKTANFWEKDFKPEIKLVIEQIENN